MTGVDISEEAVTAQCKMLRQRDHNRHGYNGYPPFNRDGEASARMMEELRAALTEAQAPASETMQAAQTLLSKLNEDKRNGLIYGASPYETIVSMMAGVPTRSDGVKMREVTVQDAAQVLLASLRGYDAVDLWLMANVELWGAENPSDGFKAALRALGGEGK